LPGETYIYKCYLNDAGWRGSGSKVTTTGSGSGGGGGKKGPLWTEEEIRSMIKAVVSK